MSKELRIIFIGTPDFAVESLDCLVKANKNVVAVITAPDRKAGRGQKVNESAVKKYAVSKSIPVMQPTNLKNEEFQKELKGYNADLQIVVAFRMLPESVWNMPENGTFNLHASLLPNYRGAAPINWAIINGEKETGVSTFFLKHKIDTGDIIFQEKVPISDTETAGTLHDKLMEVGGNLVVKTVDAIEKGNFELKVQENSETKEAPKIFKEDCKINWSKPAVEIDRLIRGMSPYPTAWCIFNNEESNKESKVKIFNSTLPSPAINLKAGELKENEGKLYIGCADTAIEILELQMEGKKRMDAKAFMNGYAISSFKAV